MIKQFSDRYVLRNPAMATGLYACIVVACLATTWAALADLYNRHAALAAATEMLDQLEGRKQRSAASIETQGPTRPPGSPLLEGPTITVAGASLLQRVATAITRVGGQALSSQVDLQGPQAKDGYVSVSMSCELEQPALQKLLYDLEAGMPFLFVDQLTVEATTNSNAALGTRLRVLLSVSGQWQGRQ
jgi:general secretion pathway protein M